MSVRTLLAPRVPAGTAMEAMAVGSSCAPLLNATSNWNCGNQA